MLDEWLIVGLDEAIVGAPTVALVLHQEHQAAAGMGEVAEAGFGIKVFATPPSEQVPEQGGEVPPPI